MFFVAIAYVYVDAFFSLPRGRFIKVATVSVAAGLVAALLEVTLSTLGLRQSRGVGLDSMIAMVIATATAVVVGAFCVSRSMADTTAGGLEVQALETVVSVLAG